MQELFRNTKHNKNKYNFNCFLLILCVSPYYSLYFSLFLRDFLLLILCFSKSQKFYRHGLMGNFSAFNAFFSDAYKRKSIHGKLSKLSRMRHSYRNNGAFLCTRNFCLAIVAVETKIRAGAFSSANIRNGQIFSYGARLRCYLTRCVITGHTSAPAHHIRRAFSIPHLLRGKHTELNFSCSRVSGYVPRRSSKIEIDTIVEIRIV